MQPHRERITWAAVLTVGSLSLLVSSALAAIATYLYFFYPSIARDKAVPSDIDGHDI